MARSSMQTWGQVAAGTVAALVAYHRGVRPRLLRWGATDSELARTLPGDGRVDEPHVVSTRAVSIQATPADVWPWLVQMGDGRGGLYSYDRLDMLFGYLSRPSAEVVLPEFQDLAVGDVIPLGNGPDWPVSILEPERALVVEPAGADVTWCWALLPADAGHTRLISRVQLGVGLSRRLWCLAPLIDLPWFLMERKMLLGIARRAEALAVSGHVRSRAGLRVGAAA